MTASSFFSHSKVLREVPYLILTFFLSILPWFWIPDGFVYVAEESNFINYDIKLETASTFWLKEGLGRDGDPANQSLLIPNAVFYSLARNLGLNPSATQKAFLSFFFLSVSVSFGLFSTIFTKKNLVRCLGLLVYLFNFYFVASIGYTAKTFLLVLMPVLFYLTVKYLKTRRFSYLPLNYIWLFSFQAIFTNLPTAVCAFAIYLSALVYHLLLGQTGSVKTTIKYFCILLSSTIPVLLLQGVTNLTVIDRIKENSARFAFSAIGAPLLDLFQFRGVWWEKSGHLGIDYFNLWQFYGNPVVVISTLVGIGAVIFSIFFLFNNKVRSEKIKSFFWLSFYLISLGLASGFYFVPGFYLWMVKNIPGMIMFRETWVKFIPFTVFSFSAMAMIVADKLDELKEKKFLVVLTLISIMITTQSYPLISGTIIDSRAIGWKRRLIKIPTYWEEFRQWSQEQRGAVILPIPFGTSTLNSLYRWHDDGLGNSTEPIPCLLGINVICYSISDVDRFGFIINRSIENNGFSFLAWGGVDYVVKQHDLEILGDQDKLAWQEERIDAFINPEPVLIFGDKLFVYKIKDQYLRPKIYVANNIHIENKLKENITANDVYYPQKIPVSLSDKLSSINPISPLPLINFEKLNQVQYRVEVSKADHPFILVLGENFSHGWKIFKGDAPPTGFPLMLAQLRRFLSHPIIDEESHFVANGYTNAWYIDRSASAVLTIIYQPNDSYSSSLLFSVCLFVVAILSYLFTVLKATKQ